MDSWGRVRKMCAGAPCGRCAVVADWREQVTPCLVRRTSLMDSMVQPLEIRDQMLHFLYLWIELNEDLCDK